MEKQPAEKTQVKTEEVQAEEAEKKSSKYLYIALGIILLFFIALFAIRFIRSPTAEVITIDQLHQKNLKGETSDINYVYNRFSFVFVDGLWYTQVQKNKTVWDVPLHFGPKQLENISITGITSNKFADNNVYITFDPIGKDLQYVALASAEISLSLTKGFGVFPIAACDKNETDACSNRPIKTCNNQDSVIYMRQSNQTKVVINGNCVIIEGNDWGIVKATDRLLLNWYKIMD
jgi:hypothetical protein